MLICRCFLKYQFVVSLSRKTVFSHSALSLPSVPANALTILSPRVLYDVNTRFRRGEITLKSAGGTQASVAQELSDDQANDLYVRHLIISCLFHSDVSVAAY